MRPQRLRLLMRPIWGSSRIGQLTSTAAGSAHRSLLNKNNRNEARMSSKRRAPRSGDPQRTHEAASSQLSAGQPRQSLQEEQRDSQQQSQSLLIQQPSPASLQLHGPLSYQQLLHTTITPQHLGLSAMQQNIFSPTPQHSSISVLPARHAAPDIPEQRLFRTPASSPLGSAANSATSKTSKPLDEYDTWTADAIRKECTRRGLKVKGRAKKDERIAILRRHDVAKAVYGGLMVGDTENVSVVENRTKHCPYRLLNILFSNEFATRFGQSGDKPPRADLDTRAVADKSCFWQDVHVAHVTVYPADHSVNALEFSHDFFVGIDPSTVKDHSSKKLFDMWKEMNRYYILAEKKFTASGQHEDNFPNFVDSRGYVVYLRKWLEIKPELNNFVKSGMLDKDQFDTLDENASASASLSSSNTTPSKSKVRESFLPPGARHDIAVKRQL
ncbi:hypothetical protein PF003_g12034 [Phytophthora fragariae]|nr:hypothetical protein PF003_g12034 [Phytophthora fragariae]